MRFGMLTLLTSGKRARAQFIASLLVYHSSARIYARIIVNLKLMLTR